MSNNYVLIKKLCNSKEISSILNKYDYKNEVYSKIKYIVDKEKKNKKDIFLSQSESQDIDKIIFFY